MENCFVEIALEGIGAEEFNRKVRRADKWTQEPGDLRPEEKIGRQPGEHNAPGNGRAAAETIEQLTESDICHDAGEGNQGHFDKQHDAVAGRGGGCRGWDGRRVANDKEKNGTETAHDDGGDGVAEQDDQERLAELDVQTEQGRHHGVQEDRSGRRQENYQGDLDPAIKRLHGAAPRSERRAEQAGPRKDSGQTKPKASALPPFKPARDFLRLAPQERAAMTQIEADGIEYQGCSISLCNINSDPAIAGMFKMSLTCFSRDFACNSINMG